MATIPARASEPARDAGTNDRRLALRRAVVESHLITVDLDFQENGALLLDLSETGMSVQLVVDAPTENTTTFQFELPERGERVEGIGRITWTDGSGWLGIQFERIDQMSRLHLAEWLSRDPLIAPEPTVAVPTWPAPHTRDEMTELRRDLATEKLEGDQALAFIVERVRSVTCATGAAIALEDGGEIVCRASSGSAPSVGARVDPNSGLSGECVRTGEIVRCDDTETDPRADTLVCRRLDLRSIVIVPVRMQQGPAGVLVAFSSQPHAFESGDAELVLRRVADLVAAIAVRQSEPASPPSSQTAMAPAIIIQAVDSSVVETVEAFVRFRPGFHGDTGIRDYLYHRLMTSLPDGGTYRRTDVGGTLLAQAEWYTALKYRNKGKDPSRGRFDLGIPNPEELDHPEPHPLVTFECGRNKKAVALLRDLDAPAEHEGPEPADITKLAREISHVGLPYGYALEFYDEDQGEAKELIRRLRRRISSAEADRLHVVVLVCIGGSRPMLTFLPAAWEERIRLRFRAELERIEGLTCAKKGAGAPRSAGTGGSHGNRVPREGFLSSCSNEARTLIEAVEQSFDGQVKLVFGGITMTVNRRPSGTLLRINKAPNSISDLDPAVSHELAALLHLSIRPTSYKIDGTQAFREAVITAVGRAFDRATSSA